LVSSVFTIPESLACNNNTLTKDSGFPYSSETLPDMLPERAVAVFAPTIRERNRKKNRNFFM
jgi:hypothetical protein